MSTRTIAGNAGIESPGTVHDALRGYTIHKIEISGRTGERETMTEKEKDIVARLNHPIYTVDFLGKWVNRNDDVFTNAFAALQAMGAKGYYEAVKQMAVGPRVLLGEMRRKSSKRKKHCDQKRESGTLLGSG